MLKRRSLALRPADSPRLPADRWRLCHPASRPAIAHRPRGSGYRASESFPELKPLIQQGHRDLSDTPPRPPACSPPESTRGEAWEGRKPWSDSHSDWYINRGQVKWPHRGRNGLLRDRLLGQVRRARLTKFLLDRDGKIIGRFGPRVRPSDPKITSAIEVPLRNGD
jgi:hypothetical protein